LTLQYVTVNVHSRSDLVSFGRWPGSFTGRIGSILGGWQRSRSHNCRARVAPICPNLRLSTATSVRWIYLRFSDVISLPAASFHSRPL